MSENKTFQIAFLASMLVHFVFFLGTPHFSFYPSKRSLESIKITYYEMKPLPTKKLVGIKPESIARKLPEIKKEEILKPPVTPKAIEDKKEVEVAKPEEKTTQVIKEVKEKKFEAVVEEEKDDVKKATYISYYRAVREKIKECADRNYLAAGKSGEGEIFLSFIVISSGELIQVMVVDERSTNNPMLKNIALNSIRDANPFPPFPQGMNQYQITFNVIISFELSEE